MYFHKKYKNIENPFYIKYSDPNERTLVTPGRFLSYNGKIEEYKRFILDFGTSRHFTMIFNTFVMMQIFNFLNARKIMDEVNVFSGIFTNSMFLSMIFMIFFL